MSNYFDLHWSEHDDPDGTRIMEVLTAHADYERIRSRRQSCVYALAGSGVPLWIVAEWPSALRETIRTAVLTVWALGFLILVITAIAECRARRILELRIADARTSHDREPSEPADRPMDPTV